MGSSPLTRGARRNPRPELMGWGLIPAYAGRTDLILKGIRSAQAHPRLRGAHQKSGKSPLAAAGSSPLTRGARFGTFVVVGEFGLIPAYAGRTSNGVPKPALVKAHPRLRGAHSKNTPFETPAAGSSPLTRGAPASAAAARSFAGLIPAYAGRTTLARSPSTNHGAHPRLRGAHLLAQKQVDEKLGSSPLTRGALLLIRSLS